MKINPGVKAEIRRMAAGLPAKNVVKRGVAERILARRALWASERPARIAAREKAKNEKA